MKLAKCPQSVRDALGEDLVCHLGVLFDESGKEHGRCPYCTKRTGGIVRDLQNKQPETN